MIRRISRFDQIGDIVLRRKPRTDLGEIEYPYVLGNAAERYGYLPDMLSTGLIIVRDQNNVGATQKFVVFVAPFAGTTGTGRGRNIELG